MSSTHGTIPLIEWKRNLRNCPQTLPITALGNLRLCLLFVQNIRQACQHNICKLWPPRFSRYIVMMPLLRTFHILYFLDSVEVDSCTLELLTSQVMTVCLWTTGISTLFCSILRMVTIAAMQIMIKFSVLTFFGNKILSDSKSSSERYTRNSHLLD